MKIVTVTILMKIIFKNKMKVVKLIPLNLQLLKWMTERMGLGSRNTNNDGIHIERRI